MIKQIKRNYGYGLFPLVLAFVMIAEAQQPPFPHVILADGRRIDGQNIRARANGDIILTTERGDLTFPRGQYREAWAARPPAIDQAMQHLQGRRFDQAISAAEQVVSSMRNLGWDNEALAILGRANVGKGEYGAAISSFDRLFQNAPARREDSTLRWIYYQALLGGGQLDRLETSLNDLISNGTREEAARAQIMRGDVRSERGQTEEAALDYLRTVVLFSAVRDVQAEALYKAGVALEAMRHDKARDMFRRVVDQHRNSPFAAQAQARL